MTYDDFLRAKVALANEHGFDVADDEIHPLLKPHQRAIVQWMVKGGRRACFAAFGLGKSMMQLEAVRITLAKAGGMGLIVIPLGVRQEFRRDAAMPMSGSAATGREIVWFTEARTLGPELPSKRRAYLECGRSVRESRLGRRG